MYPLDQLTNAARPVTLAGRAFPVRQLRLREWGDLQAWLKTVAPSPVAVAMKGLAELRAAGIPIDPETQKALFAQAQAEARTWPPRVGSPEWFRAIDQIDGGHARLVAAAIRSGGGEVSDDEAADIAEASSSSELIDLVRACVHGEHVAPKAEGAAAPTSPPGVTTGAPSSSSSGIVPDGPTTPSPS